MAQKKDLNSSPDNEEADDPFVLEKILSNAGELLKPHVSPPTTDSNVLVAPDTNTLLLPYLFGAGDLKALSDVYKALRNEGRIFLPGRALREFVRLRDRKLAELIQSLHERKKGPPSSKLPLILEGVSGFDDVLRDLNKLEEARAELLKSLDHMIEKIESWRGDDPVMAMYSEVFTGDAVIDLPLDDEQQAKLLKECRWRYDNKIPPGYKDGAKPDEGIGDFLIWKTLLAAGEKAGKHLAFVTGEQKADWFVRTGRKGVYPRIELLTEYGHASGGKSLRLITLYELLREMQAPATVVESVKEVENEANSAIQSALTELPALGFAPGLMSAGLSVRVGKVTADYSRDNGVVQIGEGKDSFALQFSKGSDRAIHLYTAGNVVRIARVNNAEPGQLLSFDQYDSSSRSYTIGLGERFLAENDAGRLLTGKIVSIKDDSRGDDKDEVAFIYGIARPGRTVIPAI